MKEKHNHMEAVLVFIFVLISIYNATPKQHKPLTISNNKNGLWSDTRKIGIENNLVLGKEYGDESEMFSYIRDITIDERDSIYVMDSMELIIKVFNRDGKFIRTFGREGQGPGEFQSLDGICWSKLDNFIYIADRLNHRINWFSTEGEFLGSINTTKINAAIEDISSLNDGRFVLTARVTGDRSAKYKIIVTSHNFEDLIAEIEAEFPVYSVGATISPKFSDVGTLLGEKIYYTSPSEYKITVLNSDFKKQLIIDKSHPQMFVPNYVRGFYADFNTIETLMSIDDIYIVGIQSTLVKNIPRFKEKSELIKFVYAADLSTWNLKTVYQLDFYDNNFQFLEKLEIPGKKRLAGRDSRKNVYFIENEPFPRIIRGRIIVEDKN